MLAVPLADISKFLVIPAAVLVAVLVHSSPLKRKSDNPISKLFVFGGHPVNNTDSITQSTVAIVMPGAPPCSGSLIADDLVLTAAHCVHGGAWDIVFGTSIIDQRVVTLPVVAYEVHPQFTTAVERDFNDLAILKFKGSLPSGFGPVALATDGSWLHDGMPVTIAGYGVDGDTFDSPGRGVLRQAEVTILDLQFSAAEMSLDQSKGAGACVGDSGGPALIQTSDSQGYFLVGIVHGGPEPRRCDQYGIYTKVYNYLSWIAQATERLHRL